MSRRARNPENAVNRIAGGYTFNAFPADDYAGVAFQLAAIRLGDHAHVEVESGRWVPQPSYPRFVGGRAGRLILPWLDWIVLRGLLDADERVRIAEVERPIDGQVARYAAREDETP